MDNDFKDISITFEDREDQVAGKVLELFKRQKNVEDVEVKVDPEKNTDTDVLNLDVSVKFSKPVEKTTVTLTKPEGMSDEQFLIMMKHLQEELEKECVYENEFTN